MGTQADQQSLSQESLRKLAVQKEKEWHEIQDLRSKSLEAALDKKQKDYDELYTKFLELKEDFKYNLKLLSERDAELHKYDSSFAAFKGQSASKDAVISELKIKIDDLEKAKERESKSRDELSIHYQKRVREKQAELENYKCAKDEEIHKERQEIESFKRNLDRQVRELEEELEIQRKELEVGFQEAMRRREHEFRIRADEMSATVLAHELKVKMLSKELEMAKSSEQIATEESNQSEGSLRNLEKLLKQKTWEMEDLKAMREAKETDLMKKVKKAEEAIKKQQEDFSRKHAEMDRYAKEKEAALSKVKEAANARESELQGRIHDLESQLDDIKIKVRQVEWSRQDAEKEKEAAVERLQDELTELQTRWDSQISEVSKTNVTKDLEVEALRENDGKLKAELVQRKEDIERYKKELSSAIEREAALERSKAQLDIDWQRRYEDIERLQYEKSEDLTKNLVKARDEALAEVKQKDRELQHKEDLCNLLTKERDQALVTLKQHGITVDRALDVSSLHHVPHSESEQMGQLHQQNENLRQVIKEMRHQMEGLGDDLPQTTQKKGSVAEEYVKNLEEELHKVKAKYRKLDQQLKDPTVNPSEVKNQKQALDAAGENVLVRSHVEQLNSTIGSLRSEKVELTAQLRKQQAKLVHTEGLLDQLSKQPREQQVRVDQLEYEIGTQSRRHQAEVASLKQRNTDLELQVVEARKEADEYHKANIERTMETTALSNQLSQLKLDLAQGQPSVNYGASELMIQQLQDEIQRLRKMWSEGDGVANDSSSYDQLVKGPGSLANQNVTQLHTKLRSAAKHIQQLAREKQQLIEVGNRLRAELKKNGVAPPQPPPKYTFPSVPYQHMGEGYQKPHQPSQLQQKIQNKLVQLEQLQYELTKKQLAQGKGSEPTSGQAAFDTSSTDIEFADTDPEENYQPTSILKNSASRPSTSGSLAPSSRPGTAGAPKLSPVPEDNVPPVRPKTAPQSDILRIEHDLPTRPSTAMSGPLSYRPTSPSKDQGGLMMSMSSLGGGSLQEIWQMLDEEGVSPRPFTPLNSGDGPFNGLQFPGDVSQGVLPSSERRPKSADGLTVKGQTPKFESRTKTLATLDPKIAGRVPAKKTPAPQKSRMIRNYNLKDYGNR